MKDELSSAGIEVNVVAINVIGAEDSQGLLTSRCSFELLQDTSDVNAWSLMGGGKDDIFVYRSGGRLAPGGFLPAFGEVDTNLSTPEGYANVLSAIKNAVELGPSAPCKEEKAGFQRAGDANQDSRLDITDAVVLLGRLFLGLADPLPCEGGEITSPANTVLHDSSGDGKVDLADAVYVLNYLFAGGPAPPGGVECVPIAGCPERCGV